MPTPEDYCYIKAPKEARDTAREVKEQREQTWREFLNDAAEELTPSDCFDV